MTFVTAVRFRRKVLRLTSPCYGTARRAPCFVRRTRSHSGSFDPALHQRKKDTVKVSFFRWWR